MRSNRSGTRARVRLAVAAAFLFIPATGSAQVATGVRGRVASQAPPTTETALVSDIPCPDPFAYHDGDDWYIFGTGAETYFLQGRELVPGRMHKVALHLDYAGFTPRVAHIWAFTIYRHRDGAYHAYGTLHLGHFHTVIGHFAPQTGEMWSPGRPITRWKLDKVLVGDVAREDWYAYDPEVVVDEDGTLYLIYVTRRGRDNHIMAQRLAAPDRADPAAPPHTLLKPSALRSEDRNEPGGMQLVEAPSIVRRQGHSIMLYSVGDYALDSYKLGVAYSDRLIPPDGRTYEKVLRKDAGEVWGQQDSPVEVVYVLQSQKRDWPNDCGGLVAGPGSGSVIVLDGRPWLLFHGYRPADKRRRPEDRFVFKLPLEIDIRGSTPSPGWLSVELPIASRR
jgi:Glycosyl hydrolases family 43